jgi:DNA-binding PadR family transcriptional regulator
VELSTLDRFAEPAVLILSSLAGGDKHGYALVKDIEGFAGVRLGPGTLYGALARLEQRGLIEALAADQRRRPYRLTASGAAALGAYLRHARTVTEVGLTRLAAARP